MKIYKIKNKEGKFSSGGLYADFVQKGKAWHGLDRKKLHLGVIEREGYSKVTEKYKGCEIVEYEMVEKRAIDLVKFYKERKK